MCAHPYFWIVYSLQSTEKDKGGSKENGMNRKACITAFNFNFFTMTKASKSVYYFGFYLLATGLTLVFVPNMLLSMFGIEPTSEVWIKVVGALAFAIGLYYILVAPANNETFLKATVYNRVLIAVWFAFFVAMGWVQWQLVLFGGVDLLGAAWTWGALRKSNQA